MYSRSFTGFAYAQEYLDNTMALAESIGDMDSIDVSMYYMAGYDAPFKWWDRHNESWLAAKVSKKSVVPQKKQKESISTIQH